MRAKKACKNPPLCNWREEVRKDKDGEKQIVIVPRTINEIVADIRQGFDGFPKRLGDLFFFDETNKKIVPIPKPSALSAWIQGDGDCTFSFRRGVGYVTLEALFERLYATAQTYTAAASMPFWPKRADVFDMSGTLPRPNADGAAFWRLIDFMCPASENDRLLMAAAFMSPLYYSNVASRPSWCVDTVDAQGSGKSTVVKLIARLYDCAPLDIDLATFQRDEDRVKRRVLSASGRQSRIGLIDNVSGEAVKSSTLAKFITMAEFSGMAPYGHGEETRANDVTWYFTVNGGSFDTDLSVRTYTLKIRKPDKPEPFWEEEVFGYIDANRPQIVADMIQMLERVAARPRDQAWVRRASRFARFDATVLSAVCKSREEFDALDRYLSATAEETNVDKQAADIFVAAFTQSVKDKLAGWDGEGCVVLPANMTAFLQTVPGLEKSTVRNVREWINGDLIDSFVKGFDRIKNYRLKTHRVHGSFLYRVPMCPTTKVKIIQPIIISGRFERWETVAESEYKD